MNGDVSIHLNGSVPSDPARLQDKIARARSRANLAGRAAAPVTGADVRSLAAARSRATARRRAAAGGRAAALPDRIRERVATAAGEIGRDPVRAVSRPVPVAVIAAVAAAAVTVTLIRRRPH